MLKCCLSTSALMWSGSGLKCREVTLEMVSTFREQKSNIQLLFNGNSHCLFDYDIFSCHSGQEPGEGSDKPSRVQGPMFM